MDVSPSFIVVVDLPVKWPALSGTLGTRFGFSGTCSSAGVSSVAVTSTGVSSTTAGFSSAVVFGVSGFGVGSGALVQLLCVVLHAYHRLFWWIMYVPLGSTPFSFQLPGRGFLGAVGEPWSI